MMRMLKSFGNSEKVQQKAQQKAQQNRNMDCCTRNNRNNRNKCNKGEQWLRSQSKGRKREGKHE
jgi:hypothetical protein